MNKSIFFFKHFTTFAASQDLLFLQICWVFCVLSDERCAALHLPSAGREIPTEEHVTSDRLKGQLISKSPNIVFALSFSNIFLLKPSRIDVYVQFLSTQVFFKSIAIKRSHKSGQSFPHQKYFFPPTVYVCLIFVIFFLLITQVSKPNIQNVQHALKIEGTDISIILSARWVTLNTRKWQISHLPSNPKGLWCLHAQRMAVVSDGADI